MAAQWPLVAAKLVTVLKGLPSWSTVSVFFGPLLSDDVPAVYATIGYVADDHAGSYNQTLALDGYLLVEVGDVRCELTYLTASTDLAAEQVQAFALINEFEAAIRADRRLGGVLSPDSSLSLSVEVISLQASVGAFESLAFTVHYQTTT